MISFSSFKVYFVTIDSIDTHNIINRFLDIFNTEYCYDYQELIKDERCFLIATHSHYGVVGGLCLSSPHSHPPLYSWHNRLVDFFRDLNDCWVGSHLLIHLPEHLEDLLSDDQLIQWHSSIFKAFYHKLIHLSIVRKLPGLRLLIDQEQYINVNCGVLPYLSERHFGLDEQSYVLSHLSLPTFSYAFFRSLVNKLDTFNDQLLEQLVEEHKLMEHPQSTVEVGYANTILH